MMFLWLALAMALWVCAIRGLREAAAETAADRRTRITAAILLAAGPPTFVFVVSAFVLLQAAPTVQFNAGSSRAMDLWSFWIRAWPALFGCSKAQTGCYVLWLIGSLVTPTRSSVRYTVGFGLLSSLWGSLLLSRAYPTA
jgi:hypothetical protein